MSNGKLIPSIVFSRKYIESILPSLVVQQQKSHRSGRTMFDDPGLATPEGVKVTRENLLKTFKMANEDSASLHTFSDVMTRRHKREGESDYLRDFIVKCANLPHFSKNRKIPSKKKISGTGSEIFSFFFDLQTRGNNRI